MLEIKGILFDLDGTVIDSERLYQKAEIKLFKEYGIDIPDEDWKIFRGCSEQNFYKISMKRYNIKEQREIFIEKGRQYIKKEFKSSLSYKNSFKDFYNYIKYKYKLGLVTASPKHSFDYVDSILGITNYFKNVITNDDCKNSKPHPEPYLKMMYLLNLDPRETLIIEDSINGISSAKAAGANVVSITGSIDIKDMPIVFRVIEDFNELRDIV
ncbi:MAG: hypothetical protein CMG07_03750 [Candidatus Marinimicrobia bacterium]|nr:hypothetical protein [Candidatus Neomarinimicrobiota bacterium]